MSLEHRRSGPPPAAAAGGLATATGPLAVGAASSAKTVSCGWSWEGLLAAVGKQFECDEGAEGTSWALYPDDPAYRSCWAKDEPDRVVLMNPKMVFFGAHVVLAGGQTVDYLVPPTGSLLDAYQTLGVGDATCAHLYRGDLLALGDPARMLPALFDAAQVGLVAIDLFASLPKALCTKLIEAASGPITAASK